MWAGTPLAYLLGGATLCMKVCHSEEGPKSTLGGHRMWKSTHLHPAGAISAVTAPEALQPGAFVPAQPLPDTGSAQAPGLPGQLLQAPAVGLFILPLCPLSPRAMGLSLYATTHFGF